MSSIVSELTFQPYFYTPRNYAVLASCALPGLMRPVRLMVKTSEGNKEEFCEDGVDVEWVDGSVEADLPFEEVSQLFGVSNVIVCQVSFWNRDRIYCVIPVCNSPAMLLSSFDSATFTSYLYSTKHVAEAGRHALPHYSNFLNGIYEIEHSH
ncbi:MAG: hypothetical protein ACREOZ_02850 [Gloeomargaritales cyanobacterium]